MISNQTSPSAGAPRLTKDLDLPSAQGVKLQGDWGELTADDVYSLNRSAHPKRSTLSSDLASVESAAKLDTVRVALKYSDANFLGRVSNYHGGNIVSQEAA